MNESNNRVRELLEYIEQVEKLKTKPAFSVPTEFFAAHQHELQGLPELQFNLQSDGDDVWLRVPRLQEIGPPDLDEKTAPWVTLPKSPDKLPELKSEVILYEGRREVARERLEDHPEVQEVFDWYIEFQWNPWAAAERPRRKTIARYNDLFSLQQAIALEGAETPLELAWGIGYASWKKQGFATPLKHPLLVQSCEVTLNEKTFDLEVRPRDIEPRLESDTYAEMELPGVRQLEAFWKASLASGAHRLNPFDPSTFEGTLKAAVGHLDPTGAYEARTEDVSLPVPNDKLRITSTWVIYGRKRSADIFLEDIRRLKKVIEEVQELPGVIRSFVEPGDSTVRVHAEQPFRGLSSSDSTDGAQELYFPMPYNDEQVSIVQKLANNDGVVVQGPPGTGKTHTIANVICHYLALGKRVLVTAKSESALAVLQEKLPERIRPLSVSLLSDERDGMKQFEHAIQTIASNLAAIIPSRAESTIAAAEAKLSQLHAKISHLDRTVGEHAGKHMRNYSFQGQDVTPEEMARLVLSQVDEHTWFDDEPPTSKDGSIPFTGDDVNALRQARMRVAGDLPYVGCKLPRPDELSPWAVLATLRRDLLRAQSIDASVTQGDVFALVNSSLPIFEEAQALLAFLEERLTLKAKVAGATQLDALKARLADMQATDPLLQGLVALCGDLQHLEKVRKAALTRAVALPADAELNEDYVEAVRRLVESKSAFKLPFGSGAARKLIAETTVAGSAPPSPGDWAYIQEAMEWRGDARKAVARWNILGAEFGLESANEGLEASFRRICQVAGHVEDARRLNFDFDAKLHPLFTEVFGKPTADRMWDQGEPFVAAAAASLHAHIEKSRLAYALKRLQELVRALDGKTGAVVDHLRRFLAASLDQPAADESVLQATWQALQSEVSRLAALVPYLEEIESVSKRIRDAGAPKWAARIRTLPATEDLDIVTPTTWLDAWNWRRAVMFLELIDGHHRLRELFEERRTLSTALAKTYQDLVAEKTWLGVHNNSPSFVRQALQAYLGAVKAMGAGTGVRAIRHRRNAREAMRQAYVSVPCWVLPQWRVSETLPAEVGLFDLVVIDEASQSDIWALPALLRGKKLLVVGDDKQVSPSAVGVPEARIVELTNRFLQNQPRKAELTPDRSIYDLASVVFAGNSVMLKEHFRCVPAIIEFSNREFYENDIRPLRVPKANERLDPPLVDVFVKGGYRTVDVNEPEAQAVIGEIETILADPQFEGRSIGVVTLLGSSQAARIHELVSERISPIDVVARKIAVGPPPVFQGRERDIMLVSMVLAPGDRAAANRADMHQRFNVALSRARDRMYLFRSVVETEFKEDSLNGRLIRHFQQPFTQDVRRVQVLRDRCESGFEQEMFDELVKKGFRVEPQVKAGGYRIDFVVEGSEGRRLALECDGDQFHGPGQWQDDMARQRVLERAGWTFWRCFASSFVRRRKEVLDDLFQTLARLGIEPLGAESVDNTVWVLHKTADPFGVDAEPEVEAQPLPEPGTAAEAEAA
ncbi:MULTISPECIES: AAA domain-containing protein [unclassified Roseateles]|uniref:AAA domain-containing protein n=1 Tax=unclassified Roseateles TaxID=2626991 RepID=UPI0006F289DC|nr:MULTISPECIES: AAA domain-containing protein [unclassified Roseateles]KQW43297.1 hypothetical protein ASC81_16005 [Pelomonas sp. Root405]KRA71035.1 hypothetical protein ASD88_14530 [Pelomonas sp. Root662]